MPTRKRKPLTMTYSIAMAAGADAADRAMRAAGRAKWSKSDYALCCKTVARLLS